MTVFDLRNIRVRSGEEHREAVEVAIAPIELGGERYVAVPETVPAELSVTRASTGIVLGLQLSVRLHGPCVRCLEEARAPLAVDTSEFVADGRPGDAPFDEDLDSQYVEEGILDLAGWARDAIAEAVPATLLCRPDCAGLCPHCGTDLNEGSCDCAEDPPDPRWDALRDYLA